MAKVLKCGDLMPGCDTVIVGKDADEVLAKAEAHARKEHNMTIIPPTSSRRSRRPSKTEPLAGSERQRRTSDVTPSRRCAERRRMSPLLDRNENDPAAARFDGVAADDLIGRPVGALDENVGLKGVDDRRPACPRRRSTTASTDANAASDFGALVLRRDRPLPGPCCGGPTRRRSARRSARRRATAPPADSGRGRGAAGRTRRW